MPKSAESIKAKRGVMLNLQNNYYNFSQFWHEIHENEF